jgi:outer membrane protein OmpA-like peptidoglycan-associated protein
MNHSGCLKAFRGETIELEKGAPLVCPECGKALSAPTNGAQSTVKIVVGVLGVGLLAVGGLVASKALNKPATGPQKTAPIAAATNPNTEQAAASKPEPAESAPPEQPAGPVVQDNSPVTPDIRKEVLLRIDEMPDLTAEKKDRLYNAVQRAREMRKVVEIPFGSGQSRIQSPATDEVKRLMESSEITKFRDDLTAIFVVLGFADSKGNKAQNFAISKERANSVKDHLERSCNIKNIIHAVPMGSTTLVDKNSSAKNRIVEIWAVLP